MYVKYNNEREREKKYIKEKKFILSCTYNADFYLDMFVFFFQHGYLSLEEEEDKQKKNNNNN